MSDPNSILTDKELRELFKSLLIEENGDPALTQHLTDMEALLAFSTTPSVLPSIGKEKELLKKLHTDFGYQAIAKWLYVLIGGAGLVFTLLLVRGPEQASVSGQQSKAPLEQHETIDQSEPSYETTPASPGQQGYHMLPPATLQPDSTITAAGEPAMDSLPVPVFTHQINSTDPNRQSAEVLVNNEQRVNIDTLFTGVKRLEVKGGFFDVDFKPASGDRLTVKGHIYIQTKGVVTGNPEYRIRYDREQDILRIQIEQVGKQQIIVSGMINIDAGLHFELPNGTDLVVENSSGNITAGGMNGNTCTLKSNYGNIRADHIGKGITLVSRSGNIELNTVKGDVIAESSHGDEHFTDIKGNLKAVSASGNLKLAGIEGNVSISAKHGDIVGENIRGNIEIISNSGNIRLGQSEGSTFTIKSNYGDIKLANTVAILDIVSRSGNILIEKSKGSITMESTYGDQTVSDITGNFKTSSTSGNVHFTRLKGDVSVSSVRGDVYGTDCSGNMNIEAQSGNITGRNITLTDNLMLSTTQGNIKIDLTNAKEDLSFDLQTVSGDINIDKSYGIEMSDGRRISVKKGRILVKASTTNGNQYYE